ncbi:uncharacterized protein PgNI_11503 [Pyricularia grisea]|uniref:Uncharacterized protein n=1 Tax=Pyricularia grisea TaxID=148305 RepID=A0A6P8ANJ4_PYRGI|nr:uncharacterized protein PgNI_11503 [Pyricularia grisea]TLD03605.1 hypothetical protein PgNI_11503 [Pyricularia grisea]
MDISYFGAAKAWWVYAAPGQKRSNRGHRGIITLEQVLKIACFEELVIVKYVFPIRSATFHK